ncbi:MAG: hypothetical protein VX577_02175 [Verrucomicrobiota bacterium]|nr:hypothetical protein [Verrucomicrobiota bacterium]
MILVLKFIIGIIFFSSATLAVEHQQLKLAVPFTDSMILQRECEVPVWGFDVHGNKVTVEFGGQIKTAVADKWGRWMVKLDPLKASLNERSMEVSNDKGKSISLEGILVGEVWFSSGQSNMVWTAGKSMCNELAREITSSKEELPIREININTVSAL